MSPEELRRLATHLTEVNSRCNEFLATVAIMKNDVRVWQGLNDDVRNRFLMMETSMRRFNNIDWEDVQGCLRVLAPPHARGRNGRS